MGTMGDNAFIKEVKKMEGYTKIDTKILNTLLKGFRLKEIKKGNSGNSLLLRLESIDRVVSFLIELNSKENNIDTSIKILSNGV